MRRRYTTNYKRNYTNNFCMIAEEDNCVFTITIGEKVSINDYEYIEYSLDYGKNWIRTNNINEELVIVNIPVLNINEGVLLRGKGLRTSVNTSDEPNPILDSYIASNAKFHVSGYAMSLLNGNEIITKDTIIANNSYSTFFALFYNNTNITNAEDLILAKNVKNSSYSNMFRGCTALLTAPLLPATLMSTKNYSHMFQGCVSLKEMPNLPATTLGYQSYAYMFADCTSLLISKELPAKTATQACYAGMFSGCVALRVAPKLPAINIRTACYNSMFLGCISLKEAPELPASVLANNCYSNMFNGCSSLETFQSVLPATNLPYACYASMFLNCVSLTSKIEILATSIEEMACYQMFRGCTSIKYTTSKLNITTALGKSCCWRMFAGCTSLIKAPELSATTLNYWCYHSMFSDCKSLISAPTILPATTLAEGCYSNMFALCTSLIKAPKMLIQTLAKSCCSAMFSGCTALISIPDLLTPTLILECYSTMLYNCYNLRYIKMLATDISATSCLWRWVYKSNSVGTFVKHPDMNDLPIGSDGIPNGWTVIDAVSYTPYQYVENTDSAKIDTGISANDNTRIEFKLWSNNVGSFYSLGTRTGSSGTQLFTLSGSYSNKNVLINVGGTSKAMSGLIRNSSGYTFEGWIQTNGDMTFSYSLDNGSVVRSDSNISYSTSLASNNLNIFLFSNGFNDITPTLRFYYFRIYQDGALVRNFVPCEVNGSPCLLDTVYLGIYTSNNLTFV